MTLGIKSVFYLQISAIYLIFFTKISNLSSKFKEWLKFDNWDKLTMILLLKENQTFYQNKQKILHVVIVKS